MVSQQQDTTYPQLSGAVQIGTGGNMAIFHEKLGYQLDHMEGSAELTTRLVGSLNVTHSPLFLEDALIQLEITR